MIENISKKVGQKFGGSKISRTFASQLRNKQTLNESKTGCSAVRLAHLLWEQGVVGSNPATPTDESQGVTVKCSSFFLFSEWGGLPLV